MPEMYPITIEVRRRKTDFLRNTGKDPMRLYIGVKKEYELRKELTPDNMLFFEYRRGSPTIHGMRVFIVLNDEDHLEVV